MHLRTTPPTNNDAPGSRERHETVIVGAGQAGLSVAYHLGRAGHPTVVLHADDRVGDNWRRHWDSLRLYNPARYCGLPGMAFPADEWAFPTRDEVADFLETYARTYEMDVRGGATVHSLTRQEERLVVATQDREFVADNVVVATGTFGRPKRPSFAVELDPQIVQLHSSDYRTPGQLQSGPVLVVGASHSGADVAIEVATDHPTILCGPSRGQIPFELEGRTVRRLFPLLWLVAGHALNVRTPLGRKARREARSHGGPLLRYRDVDLEAAGVERTNERVVGVHDGRPVLESGRVLEATNVVWCTGFHQDFSWIDLPVIDDDGWPQEHRGVVEGAPGLYFNGLAFQSSFRSMLIGGAGNDARYVARHIAARQAAASTSRHPRAAAA